MIIAWQAAGPSADGTPTEDDILTKLEHKMELHEIIQCRRLSRQGAVPHLLERLDQVEQHLPILLLVSLRHFTSQGLFPGRNIGPTTFPCIQVLPITLPLPL